MSTIVSAALSTPVQTPDLRSAAAGGARAAPADMLFARELDHQQAAQPDEAPQPGAGQIAGDAPKNRNAPRWPVLPEELAGGGNSEMPVMPAARLEQPIPNAMQMAMGRPAAQLPGQPTQQVDVGLQSGSDVAASSAIAALSADMPPGRGESEARPVRTGTQPVGRKSDTDAEIPAPAMKPPLRMPEAVPAKNVARQDFSRSPDLPMVGTQADAGLTGNLAPTDADTKRPHETDAPSKPEIAAPPAGQTGVSAIMPPELMQPALPQLLLAQTLVPPPSSGAPQRQAQEGALVPRPSVNRASSTQPDMASAPDGLSGVTPPSSPNLPFSVYESVAPHSSPGHARDPSAMPAHMSPAMPQTPDDRAGAQADSASAEAPALPPIGVEVTQVATHFPLAAEAPAILGGANGSSRSDVASSAPHTGNVAGPASPGLNIDLHQAALRTLNLALTGEDIGAMSVRMRLRGDQLNVAISSDHAQAVAALQRDQTGLSQALLSSGYQLDALSVHLTAPAPGGGDPGPGSGAGGRASGDNSGQTSRDQQHARQNPAYGNSSRREPSAPGIAPRRRDFI